MTTVVQAATAAVAFAALGALGTLGCEHKEIPPRTPLEEPREPQPSQKDPNELLTGGKLVFQDDFERSELGPNWKTEHAGWVIDKGWVHSTKPENKGLWLVKTLPKRARVEFDARSERFPDGKFPGDLKCEIFAEEPRHEGGYILINGGWGNSLDVMCRQDEHGEDRLERPAVKVAPGQVYRWAVARDGDTVFWFIDGKLRMRYDDPLPVRGDYFGFNNWASNAFYDNLRIYDLDAK